MSASSEAPVFGHYRVLQDAQGRPIKLGEGAMGMTYLAEDEHLKMKVALKVVHPKLLRNLETSRRFQREAQAAAQLRHPNVASVFHLGSVDDAFFYAMEYVAGETLRDRMGRTGPLPLNLALQITLQVCAALGAAEKQGLVHRDIKPANIMLEEDDDQIRVKLIDFGLAKPLIADNQFVTLQTLSGVFLGTPVFASPEQVEDQPLDIRSDFYSLGLTLWFMVEGRLAFEGSMSRVFYAQVHESPPWKRIEHLPIEVQNLLRRLLDKDPSRRPQTARELRQLITACLGIESVTLRADTGWRTKYQISSTPRKYEWGEIYDGEGAATGRVQLQCIHASSFSSPDDAARLIAEATKAERLVHPNVLRIHSAFHSGDASGVVLVTEPVAPSSLRELLRERLQLSQAELIEIVRCLGRALDACIGRQLLSPELDAGAVGLVPVAATNLSSTENPGADDWLAIPKLPPFSLQRFLSRSGSGGALDPRMPDEQQPEELVRRLAQLVHECLGGSGVNEAGQSYVALPCLSEAQYLILRSCLLGESQFKRAADFVAAFSGEAVPENQAQENQQTDGPASTVRLQRLLHTLESVSQSSLPVSAEPVKATQDHMPTSPPTSPVDPVLVSMPPSALIQVKTLPPELTVGGNLSAMESLRLLKSPTDAEDSMAPPLEGLDALSIRSVNLEKPPRPQSWIAATTAGNPADLASVAVPRPSAPTIQLPPAPASEIGLASQAARIPSPGLEAKGTSQAGESRILRAGPLGPRLISTVYRRVIAPLATRSKLTVTAVLLIVILAVLAGGWKGWENRLANPPTKLPKTPASTGTGEVSRARVVDRPPPPEPPEPSVQDLFRAAQTALTGKPNDVLRTSIAAFLERAGPTAAVSELPGAKSLFSEVAARYRRGDLGPRPGSLPAWEKPLRTAADMNLADALASLGDDLAPTRPEEAATFAEKWLRLAAKDLPPRELISEAIRVAERYPETSAAAFARDLLQNQFEPLLTHPPNDETLTSLRPLLESSAKLDVVPALAFLGNEALEKGDHDQAIRFLGHAAELGHPPSMNKLGLMLADKAQNGRPDLKSAADWFTKAADAGFAPAQFTLGECCLYGNGVPRDLARAFALLQAAADSRVPEAHYLLGSSLLNTKPGSFAPELSGDARMKQACEHLERALDLGDQRALAELAFMNVQGEGTVRDIREGLRLILQGVHAAKPVSACVRLYAAILAGESPLTESELKELKITVNADEAGKLFVQAARLGDEIAREWCQSNNVPY